MQPAKYHLAESTSARRPSAASTFHRQFIETRQQSFHSALDGTSYIHVARVCCVRTRQPPNVSRLTGIPICRLHRSGQGRNFYCILLLTLNRAVFLRQYHGGIKIESVQLV
eukprot:TRINITY_DN16002_c0_g1_i2.p1 TRINITY_DN16002_c0_g1~~TRINITY_DN16002_c0_g1_i2.p1  ORF type:complete len:111 (+),score=1.58 TRINITY_DN16002_c0_g1_i2:273-605(+)